MKKKIFILFLTLIVQIPTFASYIDKQIQETKKNSKYNTTQIHTQNLYKQEPNVNIHTNIKDPGLIKLPYTSPVNEKEYAKKLAADEKIYESEIHNAIYKKTNSLNINPEAVDFYNVYRISERLIRANSLDYINWRIAIRKSEDVNAVAFEGNYIRINTALYDSLYDNNDALAFVIAHEMAHLVLGHSQRKANRNKLYYDNIPTMLLSIIPGYELLLDKKSANEDKLMEHMADLEAMKFLIRAGYSPEKAISALTFLDGLPNVNDFWADHPMPKHRIANVRENLILANPSWAEEGKNNILNTPVLNCKKSSDRVSIVINKNPNPKKFYEPETTEECFTRIAYLSYKAGKMKDAIKYFKGLDKLNENYISNLYISYAYEYLYNLNKESKFKELAIKYIEKANKLAPADKHVQEEFTVIQNL